METLCKTNKLLLIRVHMDMHFRKKRLQYWQQHANVHCLKQLLKLHLVCMSLMSLDVGYGHVLVKECKECAKNAARLTVIYQLWAYTYLAELHR